MTEKTPEKSICTLRSQNMIYSFANYLLVTFEILKKDFMNYFPKMIILCTQNSHIFFEVKLRQFKMLYFKTGVPK